MARPGFWRNVGGKIVNTFLSPGTTPYGPNGQYNKTLLRNGLINLAAGAVNPLAGRLSQVATNQWGGGAAQEAGQKGWGWLANQAITPDGIGSMPVDFGGVDTPQLPASDTPVPTTPAEEQPAQLAQMTVGGPKRDGRSGMSAGSSVLADGQAAQDMVGGWQLGQWLSTRSPYKFRGTA